MVFSTLLVAEIVGLIAVIILIGVLVREEGSEARKLMLVAALSVLVYNYGYVLEMTSKTVDAAMIAIKIEYLGAVWTNFFFMVFVIIFCGKKIHVLIKNIMIVINLFTTLAVVTNELHSLYYTEVRMVETGSFPHVELEYGPVFYLYTFSLFCTTLVSCLYIYQYYRQRKNDKMNPTMTIEKGREIWKKL